MMGWLERLFGRGGSRSHDGGLYSSVQCNACGEVIRCRVNPTAELSLDEDGTYFVRKVLVGQQCFRSIEVRLRYADVNGSLVSRDARGGTFVKESSLTP